MRLFRIQNLHLRTSLPQKSPNQPAWYPPSNHKEYSEVWYPYGRSTLHEASSEPPQFAWLLSYDRIVLCCIGSWWGRPALATLWCRCGFLFWSTRGSIWRVGLCVGVGVLLGFVSLWWLWTRCFYLLCLWLLRRHYCPATVPHRQN